jgi:D-aminoacyl-tRNA deacylase
MRAVVQRVARSSVVVGGQLTGSIDKGLTVLLGVEKSDTTDDVKYMVDKIANMRIFEDSDEKMNLSLMDVGGSILAISQFTLMGDCRRGRRPSFSNAAPPDHANGLYEKYVELTRDMGITVETGKFQSHMDVEIHNDGPVTILLDSRKLF